MHRLGGVYVGSRWACWSSLTTMGFCGKKEERVERMEKNGHNRLDRNIMLGEQAHEAGEARKSG